MIKQLKNLLVEWMVYRKGIRFYETEIVPKTPSFQKVEFKESHGIGVEFYFFREVCDDIIYRKGKIFQESFIGYVIQARFEDHYPDVLRKFNNMKFFFNAKDYVAVEEQSLLPILLEIYFNFIKQELVELKKA